MRCSSGASTAFGKCRPKSLQHRAFNIDFYSITCQPVALRCLQSLGITSKEANQSNTFTCSLAALHKGLCLFYNRNRHGSPVDLESSTISHVCEAWHQILSAPQTRQTRQPLTASSAYRSLSTFQSRGASTCILESSLGRNSTMAYIAPIHRSNSVRHAITIQFFSPDEECLIVA